MDIIGDVVPTLDNCQPFIFSLRRVVHLKGFIERGKLARNIAENGLATVRSSNFFIMVVCTLDFTDGINGSKSDVKVETHKTFYHVLNFIEGVDSLFGLVSIYVHRPRDLIVDSI